MRIETIRLAGRDADSCVMARAYYLPPFAAHAEWRDGETSPVPLPQTGGRARSCETTKGRAATFGLSVATPDGYRRFATVTAKRFDIVAMLEELAGSELGAELAACGDGKHAADGLYNRLQAWLGSWERRRLGL